MPYSTSLTPRDQLASDQHDQSIGAWLAETATEDAAFTHALTLHFARNIRFLPHKRWQRALLTPTRTFDNFLSRLSLAIQSECLGCSESKVKKIHPDEQMRFRSVMEDFEKRTRRPCPRHFHILLAQPKLDDRTKRLRLRGAVNALAKTHFETALTQFYVQPIPSERLDRERLVGYDFKQCDQDDAFGRLIRTERDVFSCGKTDRKHSQHVR